MSKSLLLVRLAALLFPFACALPVSAQSLPVTVDVAGETATVRVGPAAAPLAHLTLTFDGASGLGASSLGVSARLVSPGDPLLLARLPAGGLAQLDQALPLLLTVEPPAAGGLSFVRTVRVEVHTHALAYTAGSQYRLFKAPLGGAFVDITDEIAPGSVRARGTTGGFSQFLVLSDLRDGGAVIDAKFARLRGVLATLSPTERAPLASLLDAAEHAVGTGDFAAATNAVDAFRERVSQRAGIALAQTWQAGGALANPAGELLAGAATLKFSIAFLRDYGP
jgi:hypothetical protein